MENHAPEYFELRGAPVEAVLDLYDRGADAPTRADIINATQRRLGVPEIPIPSGPDGAPVWPHTHHGSLSHWRSKTVCLLAKGNAWDWGVDIEGHADAEAAQAISDEAMDASERSILGETDDKGRFCALVFSGKESFLKAAFPRVGRVFGFDALRLLSPPRSGQMQFVTTLPLAPSLPRGAKVTVNFVDIQHAVITWTVLQAFSHNSLAK